MLQDIEALFFGIKVAYQLMYPTGHICLPDLRGKAKFRFI